MSLSKAFSNYNKPAQTDNTTARDNIYHVDYGMMQGQLSTMSNSTIRNRAGYDVSQSHYAERAAEVKAANKRYNR